MPTLRSDWELGDPPVKGAVPGFYNDSNEIWLHWVDGSNDEFLPVEIEGGSVDIAWPFIEQQAQHTDLEAIGFTNTDP
jgi:hypothetical protein